MNAPQVLFIGQHGGDTHVWAYGLGKHGIYTITATVEDVCAEVSLLRNCSLVVVDVDGSHEQIISFCHYLRTVFDGLILMFTYERDERFQLKLYRAGMNECITKPIGTPLALARIMSWLRPQFPARTIDSIGQQVFDR